MKLFSRKHKEEKGQPAKDKLAKAIARLIIKAQTAFARSMSKCTRNFSASTMKAGLIVFSIVGSSLSIYFIVEAIQKKGESKVIRIDRLSVPKYYDNDDETTKSDFLISSQEQQEMETFHNYMDSLQKTKKGSIIYDSIMQYRPGLIDSINKFEQLYQQQLQNKK